MLSATFSIDQEAAHNWSDEETKPVEVESEEVSSESELSDVGEVFEARQESEHEMPVFDNIFDLFKSPFEEV